MTFFNTGLKDISPGYSSAVWEDAQKGIVFK